jgi:hypothetical protein
MRYFRSLAFDVGLVLTLIGVPAAIWTARDIIVFMPESFLLAMIGLTILVIGVVRVGRRA